MKSILLIALFIPTAQSFALSSQAFTGIWNCAVQADIIGKTEKFECFSFDEDGEMIALREVHGGKCKGDPATAPTRAYFSYKKNVLGYEYYGQDWQPCR